MDNKMLNLQRDAWTKAQWDERNIRRYCTCGWAILPKDEENSRVLTFLNPECKLHAPNAKFDLPEGL